MTFIVHKNYGPYGELTASYKFSAPTALDAMENLKQNKRFDRLKLGLGNQYLRRGSDTTLLQELNIPLKDGDVLVLN